MTKIRFYLVFLGCTVFTSLFSQAVLNKINKGKYDEAFVSLGQDLMDDPQDPINYFYLSTLFSKEGFRLFGMRTAYDYALKCRELHQEAVKAGSSRRSLKLLSEAMIQDHVAGISYVALQYYLRENKIDSLYGYISYFKEAPANQIQTAWERIHLLSYQKALESKDFCVLDRFIEQYPNSLQYNEAIKMRDERVWEQVRLEHRVDGYQFLLDNYHNSQFFLQARKRRDRLVFEKARESSTDLALLQFIRFYPDAEDRDQAFHLLEERGFERLMLNPHLDSILAFFSKYPESEFNGKLELLHDSLILFDNVKEENWFSFYQAGMKCKSAQFKEVAFIKARSMAALKQNLWPVYYLSSPLVDKGQLFHDESFIVDKLFSRQEYNAKIIDVLSQSRLSEYPDKSDIDIMSTGRSQELALLNRSMNSTPFNSSRSIVFYFENDPFDQVSLKWSNGEIVDFKIPGNRSGKYYLNHLEFEDPSSKDSGMIYVFQMDNSFVLPASAIITLEGKNLFQYMADGGARSKVLFISDTLISRSLSDVVYYDAGKFYLSFSSSDNFITDTESGRYTFTTSFDHVIHAFNGHLAANKTFNRETLDRNLRSFKGLSSWNKVIQTRYSRLLQVHPLVENYRLRLSGIRGIIDSRFDELVDLSDSGFSLSRFEGNGYSASNLSFTLHVDASLQASNQIKASVSSVFPSPIIADDTILHVDVYSRLYNLRERLMATLSDFYHSYPFRLIDISEPSEQSGILVSMIAPDGFSDSHLDRVQNTRLIHTSDLYFIPKNHDGEFGVPINLGSTINTEYTERRPRFFNECNCLFFISDGHPGLGHSDVYVAFRQSESVWDSWSEPVNLGPLINSNQDERDFVIDQSFKKLLFGRYDPVTLVSEYFLVDFELSP